MTHDTFRGTGRTTRQMREAPHGALFVWCNAHTNYPSLLAANLGRADLRVVGLPWLTDGGERLRGVSCAIVLDHAVEETRWIFQGIAVAQRVDERNRARAAAA